MFIYMQEHTLNLKKHLSQRKVHMTSNLLSNMVHSWKRHDISKLNKAIVCTDLLTFQLCNELTFPRIKSRENCQQIYWHVLSYFLTSHMMKGKMNIIQSPILSKLSFYASILEKETMSRVWCSWCTLQGTMGSLIPSIGGTLAN